MSVGALIFDFNGILVDDESVHCALFREVLREEGVTIDERDYHERYLGYDDRGCFEAALRDGGQSADRARLDELIARKARRYVKAAEAGLRFFPSAAEVLRAAAARWPIAINSGALRPEIEYGLRRLGCLERVSAIISAEDTDKCKPDPEGYRLALAALRGQASNHSLQAAECVVFEDSLAGVLSARGAGMRTVGVATTYSADELREAAPDAIIPALATATPDWIESRFHSRAPA